CSRASILALDADGVMRSVVWRGLSDTFRRAVEGRSPREAGTQDPRPILIADTQDASAPDWLIEAARNERIRALAFIPLVADGTVTGRLIACYEPPRVFTDREGQLAA